MEDIEKRIQDTQARISKAVAASRFGESLEGKMVLDYINDRVSQLLTKMTAAEALDDRTYLSYHGAVRELQSINVMLQSTAAQLEPAKEELDALRQDTSA